MRQLCSVRHSRSQAWNSASLQGSESSRRCAFIHSLIRPCPGVTSPQSRAISGLQALAASIALGGICAIAPKIESYLAVILRLTVAGKFVVNSSHPIAPLRGEPLLKLAHSSNCGREMTTGGSNECIGMF